MKKHNILIAESDYSPAAVEKYKKLGQVYFWFRMNPGQRKRILKIADILVVRLALNVDKNIIDAAPELKIIATSTTGLNHIDTEYAGKKNIKIISLRGETEFLNQITSTAEEAWGLIIALLRNIPWAHEDVKRGNWRTNYWAGHELRRKTLGILGFGRLGKILVRYGRAFDMNVLVCDPYVGSESIKLAGAKKINMDELFKKSDVISLHVLLTDKTINLIKKRHLRLMKKSAYLINTARAELIEDNAFFEGLKKKWFAGGATDVLRDELPDGSHLKNNPLTVYAKTHNNLIIVPHIGGTTFEAMAATQNYIAELVFKYLKK